MAKRVLGLDGFTRGLSLAGLLALCGACSSSSSGGGAGGAGSLAGSAGVLAGGAGSLAGASSNGGNGGTSSASGGASGSGAAAVGGNAGSAGAANSAGASGSAGAAACQAVRASDPKLVPPTQFDAAQIALAAAVVGSCLPDDGVDRNATHMWSPQAASGRFPFRTALQAECLAHSACGCAAVEHCLGYALGSSASCTSGCANGVFTACGPEHDLDTGVRSTVDCSSVALSCDPVAMCADGAATPCDDTAFTPACDAQGRPTFCDKGVVQHGPVCSSLGLTCAAVSCAGDGASCSNASPGEAGDIVIDGNACSGTMLRACVNGKTAMLDCSQQGPGFSCQHVAEKFFCGLASDCIPADDYSPSPSDPPTCDGSQLEFCNAGRLERVDCTALGFTGCEIDASAGHYGCIPGIVP
jgi:hypothetical protein